MGDKGQIVIPAKARKIFHMEPGDNLIILGDEAQGLAIVKEQGFLDMMHSVFYMGKNGQHEERE